ncbi:MAG: IPT/TIG domain-containing protein, partial [Myxococcales bacterium]|nr:IPT/TIG domain-containing protein [Myxococcales bacterium]
MSKGRAPTLPILFVLALLAGCSEPPIRIVDVSVAPDGQDLAGPYVFAAVVQGGRGPLQVSFRVTVGEPAQPAELLGPGCGPAFPPSPGRGMVPSADAALPVDAATLADGGAAPFDGGLASDGGPNSDADTRSTGLVERCVAVPLHPVGGGRYEGRWEGPPFLDGTVLYAGVRVDDAAGETALWPPPGMSWLSWRLGTRRGPEISAIAPTAGAATGGTTVLIRGQGFGADAQVYFGGQLASVALVSPHLLEAVTPPGRPGAVDVVVDRAGARAVLVDAFAYQPPPELIRVDPVEG